MSPNLFPVLIILLVVASVVGTLVMTVREQGKQREAWRAFAARRQWSFSESRGYMEVQGLYRERQLSLLTERRGRGKSAHTVTVVRLDLSDIVPSELQLEPEGLGDKFLKLFGVRDEELGEAALDDALDMKGLTPEVHALLRAPHVGESLLRVHRHYQSFSLGAGLLEAERKGVATSSATLEAHLAPALALADALHQAAGRARDFEPRRRQS